MGLIYKRSDLDSAFDQRCEYCDRRFTTEHFGIDDAKPNPGDKVRDMLSDEYREILGLPPSRIHELCDCRDKRIVKWLRKLNPRPKRLVLVCKRRLIDWLTGRTHEGIEMFSDWTPSERLLEEYNRIRDERMYKLVLRHFFENWRTAKPAWCSLLWNFPQGGIDYDRRVTDSITVYDLVYFADQRLNYARERAKAIASRGADLTVILAVIASVALLVAIKPLALGVGVALLVGVPSAYLSVWFSRIRDMNDTSNDSPYVEWLSHGGLQRTIGAMIDNDRKQYG